MCRVAAGAIAKKILRSLDIHLVAYIDQIGSISSAIDSTCSMEHLQTKTRQSALFCPDEKGEQKMRELLHSTKKEGDSLGGIVACQSTPLPIGLGDPIYEKLDANLAKGMLSIPATKGFEIGSGFRAASMKGSDHNDLPLQDTCEQLTFATNFAGGVLGGISNGRPLFFRVAFKPPSTIARSQPTITFDGEKTDLPLPPNSRHDSCVAIRAVPIVEAMAALVLVDALLASQTTHLPFLEKSLSSEPPLS